MAKSKTFSEFDLITQAEQEIATSTQKRGRKPNKNSENARVENGELTRISIAIPIDLALAIKYESLKQNKTISELIEPLLEEKFNQK